MSDTSDKNIATPRRASSMRAESSHEVPINSLVDHYRIIRLLGRGGMGQVYLARDTKLGRRVALKMVRNKTSGSRRGALRSLVEARTTARFNHPHIVTIYTVGEYDGWPYLALEYLEGRDLKAWAYDRQPGLQEIARIVHAVATALKEAHRHQILHLDLKPSNIVMAQDGLPKVLDFGLARTLDSVASEEDTKPDRASLDSMSFQAGPGTPTYMAPEQWSRGTLTEATDIWALGIILFELIAKQRPFSDAEVNHFELAHRVVSKEPAPSLDVISVIRNLVAACLAKDPQKRPTAQEVAQTLDQFLRRPKPPQNQGSNPFRGFFAFTGRHADMFYGRDAEIAEARERLQDEPVLAVIGASGAGKSSFVQAGLLARMTAEDNPIVISMRPGHQPFQTLATRIIGRPKRLSDSSENRPVNPALVDALTTDLIGCPGRLANVLEQVAQVERTRVILFIDQLEELYTLTDDEDMQHRFAQAIALGADDPQGPVRVLFTVRDDFLSRLGKAGVSVRHVLRRVMLLQVPEPQALAETLIRPVEGQGYMFENPEIVPRMVAEVGGEPSSLPLLQFAAQALWEHRDEAQKLLTQTGYDHMGGVTGAFARHSEQVLGALEPSEVQIAKQVLLRLVTSDGTRRVLSRERAGADLGPDGGRVIDRLIDARIISGTQTGLELAHESLIQTWDRLRGWLEEDQEELRFLQEIEAAVDLWEKRGSRREEVWTQDALSDALRARKRCSGPVPERVDRFLEAGQLRERAANRRRRAGWVASFTFVALAAVVLFIQRQDALTEKDRAQRGERAAERERAEAQREGAAAAFAKNALLEARAKIRSSLQTEDSIAARFLWGQLTQDPLRWRQEIPAGVSRVKISPDGQTVATGLSNGSVHLYDVATRAVTIIQAHEKQIAAIAFSWDGHRLAISSQGGGLLIWDLRAEKPLLRLTGHTRDIYGLAFGPKNRLGSADLGGHIRVWRGAPPRLEHTFQTDTRLSRIVFDPQGRYMATTDKAVRIWNLKTGQSEVIGEHDASIRDAQLSANGNLIVTSGMDKTIRVWSAVTHALLHTIRTPFVPVGMALSSDGKTMAAGQPSGVIQFFDVTNGKIIGQLPGHASSVLNLHFSQDDTRLASVGNDQTVQLWNVSGNLPPVRRLGHKSGILDVGFSPDMRWVASGSYDQTARLWDLKTGAVEEIFGEKEDGAWSVAISPDSRKLVWGARTLRSADLRRPQTSTQLEVKGQRFLTLQYDASEQRLVTARGAQIRVYDTPSQSLARHFSVSPKRIMDFDLHQDDRHMVTGHVDGSIRVVDFQTGKVLATWQHAGRVYGVRLDPTGRFVASSSRDGVLRWWDWQADHPRVMGRHPARTHFMDMSPDGSRIVVSSADAKSYVWDVMTSTVVFTLDGHREDVNRVRFSPNGRLIVSGSDDGTVRVFHADTGQPYWRSSALLSSSRELSTHRGWIDLDSGEVRPQFPQRWRNAVFSQARRAVESPDAPTLCMITFAGRLEIWDRDTDERIATTDVPGYRDLMAASAGCLVSSDHGVQLVRFKGSPVSLSTKPAAAIGARAQTLALVNADTLKLFDAQGQLLHTLSVDKGVTAIHPTADGVWLGYRTGRILRRALPSDAPQTPVMLVDTPFSAVTRLLQGPGHTLFAGFANGAVALWHAPAGQTRLRGHLALRNLHGPIAFLTRTRNRVFAASDLGDHARWDLDHLEQPWCDLLTSVWREVPVVWTSGQPVVTPPPSTHACASSLATR